MLTDKSIRNYLEMSDLLISMVRLTIDYKVNTQLGEWNDLNIEFEVLQERFNVLLQAEQKKNQKVQL